jgi:hypothetical protein
MAAPIQHGRKTDNRNQTRPDNTEIRNQQIKIKKTLDNKNQMHYIRGVEKQRSEQ